MVSLARRGSFSASTAFATSAVVRLSGSFSSSRCASRSLTMSAAAPPAKGTATLYVKGAPGGTSRADCPFSCKALFALALKDVPYSEMYVDLTAKPDWFLGLNSDGTTPTFVAADSEVVTSSDEIVALADEEGKNADVKLYREDSPFWEAASAAIGPVFGAFAGLMKNQDASAEPELRAKLTEALKAVDVHLGACGGPFLLGEKLSAMDCNFAPKMHHLIVAGKKFKDIVVPDDMVNLHKFYDAICATDEWKATKSTDESIVSDYGWGRFF